MTGDVIHGVAVFGTRTDVLQSTPILHQLRMDRHDAKIVFYTLEALLPAIENNPHVDDVIVLDGTTAECEAHVPELRGSRPWTTFREPAAYRHRGEYESHPDLDVVKLAADLGWVVPFQFVFELTPEETRQARRYWDRLPPGPKIMIEAEPPPGHFAWADDCIFELIEAFGDLDPTFVFVSQSPVACFYEFLDRWPKAVWCREPWRLTAEFYNLCDAFIGNGGDVSTMVASRWCRRNVPRVELVQGENVSSAQLRFPEEVFYCFSRARYSEAIRSVAGRLRGGAMPDFSPRHADTGSAANCPACGTEVLRQEDRSKLAQCPECFLVYSASPADPDVVLPALPPALFQHRDAARLEHLRLAVEQWRGDPNGATVLEVDCRSTAVLRAARELGMQTLGFSTDPDVLADPRADTLGIRPGTFRAADVREAVADVVLVSHVLSRQRAPRAFLEKVEYALKRGGQIYLTIPNIHSAGYMTLVEDWPWFGAGVCNTHPTINFLRQTMIEAGFLVEVIQTTSGEFCPRALAEIYRRLKPDISDAALPLLADQMGSVARGEELRMTGLKRGRSKCRVK